MPTLNLIGRAKHGIPADAAATLLVELDGDAAGSDLRAHAQRMIDISRRYPLTSDPVIAFDPEQREQLWKARRLPLSTIWMSEL